MNDMTVRGGDLHCSCWLLAASSVAGPINGTVRGELVANRVANFQLPASNFQDEYTDLCV